jgi:ribonuclease-3
VNQENEAPPIFQASVALPDSAERLAAMEARLGCTFHDRSLLLQALLHRSAVLEWERDGKPALPLPSNERLEFLGDAILSMLVAHYAFRRFPEYDEGKLTEVRSALVRRSSLAILAEDLDLGNLMYMGRAEQRSGGRGRATVLAEALEAVLAAVFLDQGLLQAEAFLERQLTGKVELLLSRAHTLNPKSRLQELAQAHLRVMPRYTLVERRGPDHDSRFEVEARAGDYTTRGEGASKQEAEQEAAQALLTLLAPLVEAEAARDAQEVNTERQEQA